MRDQVGRRPAAGAPESRGPWRGPTTGWLDALAPPGSAASGASSPCGAAAGDLEATRRRLA